MNKNRFFGIFLLLLTAILDVDAQKVSQVFLPLTWEQASMLANKEKKLVFVDFSSGDTKAGTKLEKLLSGDKPLADFFKRNIISIEVKAETPAGKSFLPKLLMSSYPLYGFFLPYGDLLAEVKPEDIVRNPQLLLESGKEALRHAEIKRSNSRSVGFGNRIQDALEKARQEDKSVFLVIYSNDSRNSLIMDKNVFNLDVVADFYNKNFINEKIEAGQEFSQSYGVSDYPAYLFLNGGGKEIYRAAGYLNADSLINLGKNALKQAEGIDFIDVPRLEVTDIARKQGKLIFTDCYSSSEAIRKALVKSVYADPEVASFFNEHFVNNRLNMEEGEGATFKNEYGVNIYPALYFTDHTGKLVHRIVGAPDVATLLREAQRVVNGNGLVTMMSDYKSGNREPAFVEEYLYVLELADMKKEASAVASEYLSTLDRKHLKEKKYWELFRKYVSDVNSDVFKYVCHDQDEFYKLFGENEVQQKMNTVWAAGADAFLTETGFDEVGFKEYTKRLKREKVKDWRKILRDAGMRRAEKMGDWRVYVELAEEKWKEEQISDQELYGWGVKINEKCHDEAIRYKAARWFALAADEMARREWVTGKVNISSYKGFFEKLVNDLVGKK